MLAAAVTFLLAAAAMSSSTTQQQTLPPPVTAPSDDIVVDGLRDIDDPASAVTHSTLGSGRTGWGARRSQEALTLASRFATCAIKKDAATSLLRGALDGAINGASQRFAQARLVQTRSGCAQDAEIARQTGVATIIDGYDTSYYDRGAMFIRAITLFAPDLLLAKSQTADPDVQALFNAREIELAKFRLPVDRTYFEMAICLVRLQPELSVRLVKTDDASQIARLEALIVNGGLACVGNAKRVYFDPSQFRMYIADAVYRWAVAAKGVDSLIPPDA
jgi:hypothetical protein